MSRAMVTPSLITSGYPTSRISTTFRPRGPSVVCGWVGKCCFLLFCVGGGGFGKGGCGLVALCGLCLLDFGGRGGLVRFGYKCSSSLLRERYIHYHHTLVACAPQKNNTTPILYLPHTPSKTRAPPKKKHTVRQYDEASGQTDLDDVRHGVDTLDELLRRLVPVVDDLGRRLRQGHHLRLCFSRLFRGEGRMRVNVLLVVGATHAKTMSRADCIYA